MNLFPLIKSVGVYLQPEQITVVPLSAWVMDYYMLRKTMEKVRFLASLTFDLSDKASAIKKCPALTLKDERRNIMREETSVENGD